jgi:hypothetical protein
MSKKTLSLILIESIVVGISLIGFVKIVKDFILPYIPNFSGYKNDVELYIIAGFLFHIVFEYSGINLWYSKEYCKLL